MKQKVYDKGLVIYKFFEEVMNAVRYDRCQMYYLISFRRLLALQSSLHCVTVCLCAYRFYVTLYLRFSFSMSLYFLVSLSVCLLTYLSFCFSATLLISLSLCFFFCLSFWLYSFLHVHILLLILYIVCFSACFYFFMAFRVSSLVSYCLGSLIHRRALYFNPVVIFMAKVKMF